MAFAPTSAPAAWHARPALRAAAAALAGVVGAAAVAGLLLWRAAEADRARELVVWQARLASVAESQAHAIGFWVEQTFVPLRGLAENASLQLYVSAIAAPGPAGLPSEAVAAQRQYLATLLSLTATRAGFAEPLEAAEAVANVQRLGHAGLALLDAERRPLLATGRMPPISGALAARLAALPRGERSLLDVFRLADGAPVVGFVEPIYRVDSNPGADALTGYVLGILPTASGLFAPLALPPPHPPSEASMLVRADGDGVDYLSPGNGAGGQPPGALSRTTPGLDAAFAIEAPGAFAEKLDFRGTPVLATGRRVAGTPWTVVHTVATAEALADVDARLWRNGGLLLLAAALAAAAVIAAWRHGASRRLESLSRNYADLAARFAREHERLRGVVDTQADRIVILDGAQCVQFANRAFADHLGITPEAAEQKRLDALLGPAAAAPVLAAAERCRTGGHAIRDTRTEGDAGARRTLQTVCLPLPVGGGEAGSLLVVEQDVTAALERSERRERVANALVAALIASVDRRDPFAVQHSAKVAALSRAVAAEMGLEAQFVAAAELAGRLMNFGKMLVPPELLTRAGPLDGAEREQVRQSIAAGPEILAGVEFDGPVLDALRDAGERWDGSGPRGLKGDEIPVVAQIIAAANLFAAAAAPRAYRRSGGVDRAVAELQAQSGTAFDRRVVSALCHLVDNRDGGALLAAAAPVPSGPG
jgi:PAS domain S-box-containing protein